MERKERAVRVFVSSTFRDMFFDREVLVKQVFPEISRFCRDRGVEFAGIDLRTGVTAEQSGNGMVLNLCLQEVDRCRPYFLCLLGERYGWHIPPNGDGDELLEITFDNTIIFNPQFDWINSFRDRSVTELEIRHAVLNDVSQATRALFYFRQPGYGHHLLNEGKISTEELDSYQSESAYGYNKLESLKDEIMRSGFPVSSYVHHEDICELVVDQLKQAIALDFPEILSADPLLIERREHNAFAESRCKVYVCRKEYYQALDSYTFYNIQFASSRDTGDRSTATSEIFTVCGPSGVGKSSLLANWTKSLSVSDQGTHVGTGSRAQVDYIHTHFVGCSAASADPVTMLHRLITELRIKYDSGSGAVTDSTVPTDWDDLVMMLPQVLESVSGHMARINSHLQWEQLGNGKPTPTSQPLVVVIVLDAINQLTDSNVARQITWLPDVLPPYVKIIVSTTATAPLPTLNSDGAPRLRSSSLSWVDTTRMDDSLSVPELEQTPSLLHCGSTESSQIGTPELVSRKSTKSNPSVYRPNSFLLVQPLDTESVRAIAVDYMREFGKTLADQQLRLLCACEQTKNPLFLRTVLEEVRIWGHFELLDTQISRYLSKETIGELFDFVLSRMEVDYNPDTGHVSLVQDALRALACSRFGLSEFELQQIVDAPRIFFSGFFLSIQQSLTNRNGLLHFFHDFLRLTIDARYFSSSSTCSARRETHAQLARYFAGTADTYLSNRMRNLAELPWHLLNGDMLSALQELIKLPSVAVHILDTNRLDLFRMWRECGDIRSDSMGYDVAGSVYTTECAHMLDDELRMEDAKTAADDDGIDVLSHILSIERNIEQNLSLSEKIGMARKLADFLMQAAQYAAAETILDMAQARAQTSHERVAMNIDRAGLYLLLCKYQDGIHICENVLAGEGGQVDTESGAKEQQTEDDADTFTLSSSMLYDVQYMLAKLYSGNGQYLEADELFRAVHDFRLVEFGANRQQMADVLNDMAKHCFTQRKYPEALELYKRVLSIKRITIGEKSTSFIRTVRDIGMFYHDLADYDVAIRYFENALDVTERSFGWSHPAVADILNEMAFTKYMQLKNQEQYNEATDLYERALRIREMSFGEFHRDTAVTLNHLANVYRARLEDGDLEAGKKAVQLYERAKRIKEHIFSENHPEVLLSRNNLAIILLMENKFADAALEHTSILHIRQQLYGADHLQTAVSYKNCGLAELGLKNYSQSLQYHFKALDIRRKGFGEEHVKTAESYACVGDVYVAIGQPSEALQYYHNAVVVWDQKWGENNKSSQRARVAMASIELGEASCSVAKFC